METFEEWLDWQRIDPTSLPDAEVADLREFYQEARERRRALQCWTLGPRLGPDDFAIAVVVKDGATDWLAQWVKRSRRGEYFAFIPLPDPSRDAHCSFHKDGRLHQRGSGETFCLRQCQRPDEHFRGAENLWVTQIEADALRGTKALFQPSSFSDCLTIPIEDVEHCQIYIAIDVVGPGQDALQHPMHQLRQHRCSGFIPEIVVTLWDGSRLDY